MKKYLTAGAALSMLLGTAGAAAAQPQWGHDNHGRDNHGRDYHSASHNGWNDNWRRGARMDNDHLRHASRVDWRRHHLRAPPRGYEWREVDGNYVLAAVATGVIADLILNSR